MHNVHNEFSHSSPSRLEFDKCRNFFLAAYTEFSSRIVRIIGFALWTLPQARFLPWQEVVWLDSQMGRMERLNFIRLLLHAYPFAVFEHTRTSLDIAPLV